MWCCKCSKGLTEDSCTDQRCQMKSTIHECSVPVPILQKEEPRHKQIISECVCKCSEQILPLNSYYYCEGYQVGPGTNISFHPLRHGYSGRNQTAQIFQKSDCRKTYSIIIMLVSDAAEMRSYISTSAELATFNHYIYAQFPAQWGLDFHLVLPDTITMQIKNE